MHCFSVPAARARATRALTRPPGAMMESLPMEQEQESKLPKELDTAGMEADCRRIWDEAGIYLFDPTKTGEVFSVDTPPPYVSASHLHVGHAMSYAQAEFIVRYHRMNG